MNRRTVLIVVGHYLPGFKAGGPVRTLANLVARLGDEFDFRILTRDRDLGDAAPYQGATLDAWQEQGNAQVMYLTRRGRSLFSWARLLSALDYDVLYLNSFFDTLSVQSILLRRLGLAPRRPVVIAPRGEFSAGALGLKAPKKRMYIALAKAAGLYRGVRWQASSEHEARDIARVFPPRAGAPAAIHVAPNLPPQLTADAAPAAHRTKSPGHARVVFIARIARMKNLSFALRVLAGVQGEIDLDIYGPVEDRVYWQECQELIRRLPTNVSVNYRGPVPSAQVPEVLAAAHLFLLPTLGENFGHAIFEALSAGCPVLISDRTPWRDLAGRSAGWDISLDRPEAFVSTLDALAAMPQEAWLNWSAGARQLALDYSASPTSLAAHRRLFADAPGGL